MDFQSLFRRGIYSDVPPPSRTKDDNMATLLYSWWCTIFSIAFIITRLGGRLVRNDMLFREDKIMALAVIPLLIRMGFVHVVLIWGTLNQAVPDGADSTLIYHREIGSRLVLGARIFYALYIWTAKFTVLEFLKRMTCRFWRRSYERGLRCVTYYLVASFFAVIVSTLAECNPVTHYWQVVPDPGPKCREAYAQLITMGVADITTDILIVGFPVPIILASSMPLKRKISLTLLFSLSLILIVVTAYRVPSVIARNGRQQYRTVWASSECLAAAMTSNAVVIGSFLRDRGLKKNKYKFGSATDSLDTQAKYRRLHLGSQHWGSDEDLIAGMGYRLDPELQSRRSLLRPAGPVSPVANATPPAARRDESHRLPINSHDWQFPSRNGASSRGSEDSELKIFHSARDFDSPMVSPRHINVTHPVANLSFADIGGLLDSPQHSRRSSRTSSTVVPSPTPNHIYNAPCQPTEAVASQRRGSRSLLLDIGGMLPPIASRRSGSHQWPLSQVEEHELSPVHPPPPSASHATRSKSPSRSRSPGTTSALDTPNPPIGIPSPHIPHQPGSPMSLQDAGGLLSIHDAPATPATIAGNRQSLQDVGGLLSSQTDDGITPATTTIATGASGCFTPPRRSSRAESVTPQPLSGLQSPMQQAQQRQASRPSLREDVISPNFSRPHTGRRGSSVRFREDL